MQKPLTIFHFNDVYELEARETAEPVGGAAKFCALLKNLKSECSGAHVTFFSGDALNPSMLSTVTRGKHMVPVLNELGIAAACVGNHDFDFGVETFAQVSAQTTMRWMCSNCNDRGTGEPLGGAHSWAVVDVPGWGRIGVAGFIEAAWLETLSTVEPTTVEYFDAVLKANEVSGRLRSEFKVDMLVALTHMRLANDEVFASNIIGWDLVLGGHDHEYTGNLAIASTNGKPALVKSGTDFRYLSEIRASREPQDAVPVHASEPSAPTFLGCTDTASCNGWYFSLIRHEVRSGIPDDPTMSAIVSGYKEVLGKKLHQVVGLTTVPLDATFRSLRTQETNIGSWVADIMRQATEADVSILNAGTLRADAILGPGPLRMEDLVRLLPMQDTVVKLRIPGEILIRALENSVSAWPRREGRFAQVSGMRFRFDASAPPGSRIIRASVFVLERVLPGGQPRAPTDRTTPAADSVIVSADEVEIDESEGVTGVIDTRANFGTPVQAPASPFHITRNMSAPASLEETTLSASSINEWKRNTLNLPAQHVEALGGVCGSQPLRPSGDAILGAGSHAVDAHVGGIRATMVRMMSTPNLTDAEKCAGAHFNIKGNAFGLRITSPLPVPSPPTGFCWVLLDEKRTYTVATKHYVAKGKDGYDCMLDPRVVTLLDEETGPILPALVRTHFRILAGMSGYASWQPPTSHHPSIVGQGSPSGTGPAGSFGASSAGSSSIGISGTPASSATPNRLAPLRGSIRRVPSLVGSPSGGDVHHEGGSMTPDRPTGGSLAQHFAFMAMTPNGPTGMLQASPTKSHHGLHMSDLREFPREGSSRRQEAEGEGETGFTIGSSMPFLDELARSAKLGETAMPGSPVPRSLGLTEEGTPRPERAVALSHSIRGGDTPEAAGNKGIKYALAICPMVDGRITILNVSEEVVASLE